MKKEGNHSNICSRLGSLVLSSILVLFLLYISLFFSFPPLSESSWAVLLLTVPIVLGSTFFLVVTLRKKKGSESEDEISLIVQEMMMQQKEELLTEQIALINNNEQEAESQSDSSFPSDSETTSGSAAMDEKFDELNAKNDERSISGETEGSELDQNSYGILGIYESSASDNEDDDDDLIEINLPSSHFSGLGKELGQRLESNLPYFLPEAMFKQEGLMELLAEINEMNEDDNLIEIDISMGSSNPNTTYPDLRLKQEMPFSGDQFSVVTD